MSSSPPVGHLVVVGASLAGVRAIEGARAAGYAGRVTLVGAEEHLPYDRPPLSKAVLSSPDLPTDLYFHTDESIAQGLDVGLRLGAPATGLDTDAREVVIGDERIGFDALVIATGSSPRRLPVDHQPGGVLSLRTVDDALALRDALQQARHITVVGAGFVGAEATSVARDRGVEVTMVEAAEVPLVRAVGATMGTALAALHRAHGTDLRCGTSVVAVHGGDRVEAVTLSDGSTVATDLVLVGVGSEPCTGWLAGSGVEVDNGVVCDEYLQTAVRGVYAAGDVARWPNHVHDRRMRLENWTSAAEQGRTAGVNASRVVAPTPYATVPYFWSDWYGRRIQFVGVADSDETLVVSGTLAGDRFVVLYRDGDRVVGALAVDHPSHIMKYRALIGRRASWADALDLAAKLAARATSAGPRRDAVSVP